MRRNSDKSSLIQFPKMFCLLLLLLAVYPVKNAEADIRPLAEIYNETFKFEKPVNNWTTLLQALEGMRWRISGPLAGDFYLKQRFGGDADRDYWNNRAEAGIGARLGWSRTVYLGIFAEYMLGRYIDRPGGEELNPYDGGYEDLRVGLIFWHGWDAEPYGSKKTVPLTFWDEVYADAINYRLYNNNLIYYLNANFGIRLMRLGNAALDLYVPVYFVGDKNGDPWNNRYDLGGGIRIKPFRDIEISIFAEFLSAGYISRDSVYENPYESDFFHFKFGFVLWHGWGFD